MLTVIQQHRRDLAALRGNIQSFTKFFKEELNNVCEQLLLFSRLQRVDQGIFFFFVCDSVIARTRSVHIYIFVQKLNYLFVDTQLGLLQHQLSAALLQHRALHNTIIELQGNIRVFVRVRPFLLHERSKSSVENGIV